MNFSRIPFASLLLVVAITGVYFWFSNGTLYLPDATVQSLSLNAQQYPESAFTHLFIHVGVLHLIGNVVPLFLFALLFEFAVGALDVLVVFFASGVLASTLFVLTNPGVFLVGASAGVSGLIGAAFATRPRATTLALLFTPLLLGFVVYPYLSALSTTQASTLEEQTQLLQQNLTLLVQQNRTAEAAQVNQTLTLVQNQKTITEQGRAREAATPSDLSVHVYGALIGIAYVFLARRDKLDAAGREILDTGNAIRALFEGGAPKN